MCGSGAISLLDRWNRNCVGSVRASLHFGGWSWLLICGIEGPCLGPRFARLVKRLGVTSPGVPYAQRSRLEPLDDQKVLSRE